MKKETFSILGTVVSIKVGNILQFPGFVALRLTTARMLPPRLKELADQGGELELEQVNILIPEVDAKQLAELLMKRLSPS